MSSNFFIQHDIVTFLMLEVFEHYMSTHVDDPLSEDQKILLSSSDSLKHMKFKTDGKSVEDLVFRINKAYQDLAEIYSSVDKELKSKSDSSKIGFGKSFMDWIVAVDNQQCCLLVADYNPIDYKLFYCDTDCRQVMVAFRGKVDYIWMKLNTGFEASVYGFGGSLKTKSGDDDVVDLQAGSEADIKNIKDMMRL